jgi:selenocysteine-specific elongation factor
MNASPRKQIILGTAGHIDHGKTSLIKAVTGTNTDRLKEEMLRGITIELGFAHLDLPSGRHVGIVDVPGHEKFVKNMVAGATGIDLVAMVIAADEGVMPQTREHLEICSLLEVTYGLVVLTKIDMVEPDWLDLVTEDIRGFVQGTFLENAPIVPVSSVTGQGVDNFVKVVDDITGNIQPRVDNGLFRLPVDRVFTMKGFGTVITGSLVSGEVKVGERIMIYPSGVSSKVRGIQFHNQSVETAHAGMRTAINFQGLDKAEVNRGDTLGKPDTLQSSYMVDVSLFYLPSNPKKLKNRTRIRFHTGTSEVFGVVVLLDRDELDPGSRAPAQLRLDAPVSLVKDDRFVIRSYSPVRTIAGGRVLNPIPQKQKRFKSDVIEGFQVLEAGSADEILRYHIQTAGFTGVGMSDLKLMTNLAEKPLEKHLEGLLSKRDIIQLDKENRIFLHSRTLDDLKNRMRDSLTQYHKDNPMKNGMSKEELKSKLPEGISSKLYTLLLNQMIKEQEIALEDQVVRLIGHQVASAAGASDIRKNLLSALKESALMPPYARDLVDSIDADPKQVRDMLMVLVGEGMVSKTRDDLFFDAGAVKAVEAQIIAHIREKGSLSTQEFKEMTGISRKYLIPLIEYFDTINVTIRVGEVRKLRKA